jgi:HD-GYP domain-containing protein (c-di-GMP phosphodiesterase class II)
MTEVIANAVSVNDSYTYEHNKIVGNYAKIIATEIGYEHIDDIYLAAKLHDIGKISIPSSILNKQGKLTPAEYSLIRTHPEQGYNIIKNIEYFSHISLGIKHHHEHWDGTGYPDGLRGDDIPLIAQIISIADVYDALTSDRSYRPALSHKEAVEIIVNNSGKQFNPLLIKAFINKLDVFESALRTERRH